MQAETVNSTNDIVSLEDRGWQFHEHSVWMSLCGFRYGWSNFDSSKQEKNQWQRQDIHVNSEDLKKSGFWWFQCSFMDYLSKWLETNNIDYFTLMNIIFIFATKCRKTSSHYVEMNHILGHIRISKEDALTNTDVYMFALDVYEWGCHIYTTRPSSSSVFFQFFSLAHSVDIFLHFSSSSSSSSSNTFNERNSSEHSTTHPFPISINTYTQVRIHTTQRHDIYLLMIALS